MRRTVVALLWVGGLLLGSVAGPSPASAMTAQATLLDINTATVPQLMALPGMGAAYAHRVVAGRPYTAKNQLVTRGVLPASAYELIRDRIVAHRRRAD